MPAEITATFPLPCREELGEGSAESRNVRATSLNLPFGNAANNGRMLGEMDARSPVVGMINEIAHVLTGRSEIKPKKKPGLGNLLGKLSRNKK